jgi:hypothetical protein
LNFNLDVTEQQGNDKAIVSIGGKLPHSFQVATNKFLDVVMALSSKSQNLSQKQKQRLRKDFNAKLHNKCRPGFYSELSESLHFAYAGQP